MGVNHSGKPELPRTEMDEEIRLPSSPGPGPLVLCLLECLDDAHEHSPLAARHLADALTLLGTGVPLARVVPMGGAQAPSVLACYLEFLIPEIGTRSHPAARQVRDAVQILKGVGPRKRAVRYH